MTGVLVSVTALLLSVSILLVGHGLQLTLVPLYADSLGWSARVIGYIGSAYFVGFVVGCVTIPKLVARVGHIRMFSVLAAVATAALLSVGIMEHPGAWALARFATGWGFAGLYMVIESWLNERSGPDSRGGILSVYTIITLVAICIGQTFIGFDLGYMQLILLGAMLIVLGTIPVGLTSGPAPEPIPSVSFKLREVYRVSHVAVVGAFLGGFVTGGFWSLGPVIARAQQLDPDQIGVFMAVTILGGATFQLPIGRLSDWFDRRLVILLVAIFGLGVCVLATLLGHTSAKMLYLLMFVFGGMTFPLYALCLAHANDNTNLGLMEVASVILLMSSAGAVLGPMMVAYTLEYNSYALFMVSGVALGVLAIWTALRIQIHEVARKFFMPFVNISRTTQGIVDLVPEDDLPTPPAA